MAFNLGESLFGIVSVDGPDDPSISPFVNVNPTVVYDPYDIWKPFPGVLPHSRLVLRATQALTDSARVRESVPHAPSAGRQGIHLGFEGSNPEGMENVAVISPSGGPRSMVETERCVGISDAALRRHFPEEPIIASGPHAEHAMTFAPGEDTVLVTDNLFRGPVRDILSANGCTNMTIRNNVGTSNQP